MIEDRGSGAGAGREWSEREESMLEAEQTARREPTHEDGSPLDEDELVRARLASPGRGTPPPSSQRQPGRTVGPTP